ncbi:MAG: hypothetical protein RML92_04255 [Bacteroidia bacterium]|nr:hypothetical protein [Bacteroidia bacterium]
MNWHEVYLHMKAGTALDEIHQKELASVLEKYPFFAMGRMMMAKVATKLGDSRAQQLRFLGALYAPSRQHYAFFLEEKMRPRVAPPPRITGAGREPQTPPVRSEQKDEKAPSSEEPGPAEMPYSEAFLPPLQGWIAARQVLYAKAGQRIRSQLRIASIPAVENIIPPSAEGPPSLSPPATQVDIPAAHADIPSEYIQTPPTDVAEPQAPIVTSPEEPKEPLQPETPFPSDFPPTHLTSTEPATIAEPVAETTFSSTEAVRREGVSATREPPSASHLSHSRPTKVTESTSNQPLTFSPLGVSSILQIELPLGKHPKSPPHISDTSEATALHGHLPELALHPPSTASNTSSIEERSSASPEKSSTLAEELIQPSQHQYESSDTFSSDVSPRDSISDAQPGADTPTVIPSGREEVQVSPLSEISADELREQFHRTYIPLESVSAPIHLPSQPPDSPIQPTSADQVVGAELREQFLREYIPLDDADKPLRLSPTEAAYPPTPENTPFKSESPIRAFIPFDIDLEASVHLPVPNPESADSLPIFTPTSQAEAPPPPQDIKPKASWESFLAELQKEIPLPDSKSSLATKELENLRHEFIRRLLARRLVHPHLATPTQENNLIDRLISKLSALQSHTPPSVEREVPELSIPNWEPVPSGPRVYTETMARLHWSQGDIVRAIEIYEALSQKHPEKAAYYHQQIARIRSGEMP